MMALSKLFTAMVIVATIGGLARAAPSRGADEPASQSKSKIIGIVLFDEFETLDVFGPVQMWGRLPDHKLVFVSADGRAARSSQGAVIQPTYSFRNAPAFDVLMVPGGMSTRKLLNDPALLAFVRKQDRTTRWTTSVCTGAVILAKAGVLEGRKATTNKQAFAWVKSQSPTVHWQGTARWVTDGKYLTSSGVSAGTDMALALVESLYGRETAKKAADVAEYQWNDDPTNDPFAVASAGG